MIRTIIFSLALVIAASVLGYQVKQVGGGRESISVKGLAEKPVRADRVEWTVRLQAQGATLAEALAKLRREKPALDKFLADGGFPKEALTESNESVEPNFEEVEGRNGNPRFAPERARPLRDGAVGARPTLRPRCAEWPRRPQPHDRLL